MKFARLLLRSGCSKLAIPLLFSSLHLFGCAAELDNPGRFMPDATADCSTLDIPLVLSEGCAGSVCHPATNPAADLDLVSPGVAERLIDVASGCNDRLLFDSANPTESYLSEKLIDSSPECGSRMPLGAQALPRWQVTCIEEWLGEQN